MKRAVSLALVLILVLGLSAAARADTHVPRIGRFMQVVKCKQYISLRDEPDTNAWAQARLGLGEWVMSLGQEENGFIHVSSVNGTGWALAEYLLPLGGDWQGPDMSGQLTSDQRYRVNVFLSNFTEQLFCWDHAFFGPGDDSELVEYAINHIWFNNSEQLEWIDQGEYNVRLSDKYIQPVVDKYFGKQLHSMNARWYDYIDGYYYWTETGGHTPDGFAQITEMVDLGNDYYEVYFEIYGSGMYWENAACRYSLSQARSAYPEYWGDRRQNGYAVIYAPDLNEMTTFKLLQFAIDNGW